MVKDLIMKIQTNILPELSDSTLKSSYYSITQALFNKIVEEMVKSGEVDELSHYPSLRKYNMPADFKFILLNSRVAIDDALTPYEQFIVKGYRFIKSISLSTASGKVVSGFQQTSKCLLSLICQIYRPPL